MTRIELPNVVPESVQIPRAIRRLTLAELQARHARLFATRPRSDAQQHELQYVLAEIFARQEGTHTEPPTRAGSVYLVACAGRYKLGRAKDVGQRLRALRTASPDPITLIASLAVADTVVVERDLHQRYAHCHLAGEWYALTPAEVAEITAAWQGDAP